MDLSKSEVAHDVFPYLRVYKDGRLERLVVDEFATPTFDLQTGVTSTDIVIIPETGVSGRLYRLNHTPKGQKLPLVVYFHGGAFCVSSAYDPKYHYSLNRLVAEANIIALSVDYRRAPEHPLPAAYDDSWAALQWVASHASGGDGTEDCLRDTVDFTKVFLAGDSAGANIAHHMAIRIGNPDQDINGLKLLGIIQIHPYFWGEKPIGSEITDTVRKALVDKWWQFVCPSDRGNDDLLINPFAEGAPPLTGLACDRILVCVAEKDILRDRGKLYYESLQKSEWKGKVELIEIEGEDHVFHIFAPDSERARKMIKGLAAFIKQDSY